MSSSSAAAPVLDIPTDREYEIARPLKYGCNPHQLPAAILSIKGQPLPFTVLNGTPGYINLLDAVNAWQLVRELRTALNLPAAASFKHVSPAGAAVATPIDSNLSSVYEIASGETLTPSAIAYMRARQADPKCSFGDFAALSDTVDVQTAEFLKKEVSDGIIAPDYEEKALEILKTKKGGGYIILKANIDYKPPAIEYREIAGVVFAQRRNDIQLTKDHLQKVVTKNKSLSEDAIRDLLVASITAKYTQSNTVVYAVDGQAIGVGAGQQSRVDCVKLAGGKAEIWWLRQHPKVKELKFKDNIKRVERTNARIAYIEGGMTKEESKVFNELFLSPPEPLTLAEKESWIAQLKGVSVCSDAFFPFRDNIDQASKRGVHYISQPGGSVQDEQVIAAADEYGMVMAFTNVRLFHH